MGKKRIVTTGNTGGTNTKPESTAGSKSSKRNVLKGIINVTSSYNNTIVSIADSEGKVFAWSSAGSLGFKGARKSTPFAATLFAREATEKAKRFGFQEAKIIIR